MTGLEGGLIAALIVLCLERGALVLDQRVSRREALIERAEWRAERAQLIDRVQSGDITQYHALQQAYYAEAQTPEVTDWNHDDFGFVSEPRVADPEG